VACRNRSSSQTSPIQPKAVGKTALQAEVAPVDVNQWTLSFVETCMGDKEKRVEAVDFAMSLAA
jgi:hypothetical protein